MNLIIELVGGQRKYALRRAAAVVLLGIAAELAALKVLSLLLRVLLEAGFY